MQFRPAFFARYMAVSACRINSLADNSIAVGEYATPMLAVTNMSPSLVLIGLRSESSTCSASTTDCVTDSVVASKTTNSSPAIRATVAWAGTADVRRRDTSVNTSSPIE